MPYDDTMGGRYSKEDPYEFSYANNGRVPKKNGLTDCRCKPAASLTKPARELHSTKTRGDRTPVSDEGHVTRYVHIVLMRSCFARQRHTPSRSVACVVTQRYTPSCPGGTSTGESILQSH